MKATLKIFGLVLLVAIVMSSCRKNVQVVKKLDGSWKIESQTINGVNDTSDFSADRAEFEKCNVNNEDCPGTIIRDGVTYPITYTISGDGTKATVKFLILGFTVEYVYNILELTKTTMHTTYTDPQYGTNYDTHWEKI